MAAQTGGSKGLNPMAIIAIAILPVVIIFWILIATGKEPESPLSGSTVEAPEAIDTPPRRPLPGEAVPPTLATAPSDQEPEPAPDPVPPRPAITPEQLEADLVEEAMSDCMAALASFQRDHGRYPESLEEMLEPPALPSGEPSDSYVSEIPSEFWYHVGYRFPAESGEMPYALYFLGPNGLDDGGAGDDVTYP